MTAHRDQSVTTCRLGDAHGDAGHLVLIVDVDPAGLDLAGRRLLARVREAVAAWEVAEAAQSRSEASGVLSGCPDPRKPVEALRNATSTQERGAVSDGPSTGRAIPGTEWPPERPRRVGAGRSAPRAQRDAQGRTGGAS